MILDGLIRLFRPQDKQGKSDQSTAREPDYSPDETSLRQLEILVGKINKNELDGVINQLEELISKGLYEASYYIGLLYEEGRGVEKNLTKAREYYEIGASKGDTNSQYRLGYFYATGLGSERDYDKALTYFSKAAEKGHPKASYNLGLMYELGLGTIKDLQKAEAYYKKATEGHITEAFIRLANIYLQRGKTAEAKALVDEALKKDKGRTLFQLARFSVESKNADKKQGIENMLNAFKAGELNAGLYLVKVLLENGEYDKAFSLCLSLHEKGILEATHNLATLYYHGLGIQQDKEKAISLYKLAAEKGLAISCYTYGVLKYTGKEMEANYDEAYSWVLKAANMGFYPACFLMAIFLSKGIGCKIDEAKAEEWFKKGIKLFNPNEEIPIQVDKNLIKK